MLGKEPTKDGRGSFKRLSRSPKWWQNIEQGWRSGNAHDSHSGGVPFESRPRHLFWQKFRLERQRKIMRPHEDSRRQGQVLQNGKPPPQSALCNVLLLLRSGPSATRTAACLALFQVTFRLVPEAVPVLRPWYGCYPCQYDDRYNR